MRDRVAGAEAPAGPAAALLDALRDIVGAAHCLTGDAATRPYRSGYRTGGGPVLAAVRPGSLVELWRVVRLCVAKRAIVIMQAANTGLTGGSTPEGADYDRPVIVVSTRRLTGVQLIDGGRQAICLPGATLYELEATLRPLGREPHSVIGSSCIGASVMGGICNNSGGALVRRGPAFTELALYARVDAAGELCLVNDLGVELGDDPEAMLARLEEGAYRPGDIADDPDRYASDRDYGDHVRAVDAPTPARFNADPRRLCGASGSAGKAVVFAVRLDTFLIERETRVFYVGTNDVDELTAIRRDMLARFVNLPIAAEYIHRDAFDMADVYGKDTVLAIRALGTDRLPRLFALKARLDTAAGRFGRQATGFSDRLLQRASRLFPDHLPRRLRAWRDRYAHHLLIKAAGPGIAETGAYLESIFPSSAGAYFECTVDEGEKAFLHRFAVAGAAVRYRHVHHDSVEDIVALDIALPRNARDWFEALPEAIANAVTHKLYYGHFFCHVFHQDYIVRKGQDPAALEHAMCRGLDARGAEYPAEHNVGHLYPAKPQLAAFYRALDPCNAFNPGIGQTSKRFGWR